MRTPRIHVTDPDGYLPLGLTREEIASEEYGFEGELYASIMKDWVARILVSFPEQLEPEQIGEILAFSPMLAGDRRSRRVQRYYRKAVPDCLFASDGFCLPFSEVLKNPRRRLKRLLCTKSIETLKLVEDLSCWDCVVLGEQLVFADLGRQESLYRYVSALLKRGGRGFDVRHFRVTDSKAVKGESEATGARDEDEESSDDDLWYDEELYGDDDDCEDHSDSVIERWVDWRRWNSRESRYEPARFRWLVESRGMGRSRFPFDALLQENREIPEEMPVVAEFNLAKPWHVAVDGGLVDHWWQRFFGTDWIPWKKEERRARFEKAYQELASYAARYEK